MGIYSSNNGDDSPPLGLHAEQPDPDPDPELVAETERLLRKRMKTAPLDVLDEAGYNTVGNRQ
jgi:hypothetical protein